MVFYLFCRYLNIIRFFSFQVYKIENSENNKVIFIAEAGLYEMIKKERPILLAAALYDVQAIENTFNQLINAAVENYNVFIAEIWHNPSQLEIEILANFDELFEYLIDIKKNEAAETNEAAAVAAADAVAAAAAEAVAAARANEPESKKQKTKKIQQ